MHTKRLAAAVLCIIMIISCAVPAIAASSSGLYDNGFAQNSAENEDGIAVVRGITADDVIPHCDIVLSDFNGNAEGWRAGAKVGSIYTESEPAGAPYRVFEGDAQLAVNITNDAKGRTHIVNNTLASPVNAARARSLFVAVSLVTDDNTKLDCDVTVYAVTSTDRISRTATVKTGELCGLILDINELKGKRSLTGLIVSYRVKSGQEYESEPRLMLDYAALSNTDNLEAAINFMTDRYLPGGGEITVGGDCISFISRGAGSYIETASLPEREGAEANALCVKLSNYSGADEMTFYYTTEDEPQYKSVNSRTIKLASDSESHYYYIPMPNEKITQFRLVFSGEGGLVNIYMIRPTVAFPHVTTEYGSLDSVMIAENKRDVIISGTISEEILSIYLNSGSPENMPIALYCLDPSDDPSDIITLAISQIDSTGMKSSFRFVVPLETDTYSRLLCKFAVGITTENGITLIDDCMYITNPEILSKNDNLPTESASKKAFFCDAVTAEELVSDAYYEINLCRAVSNVETELYITNADGTFYFDPAYFAELDLVMERSARSDVSLTAALTTDPTGDEAKDAILLGGSTNGVPDITERERVAALSAVVSFITERYSRNTPVITGYIVGRGLFSDDIGEYTLSQFVTLYSNIYRMIHTAVRSVCDYPGVFIHIDSGWDGYSSYEDRSGFSSRQILDLLAIYFEAEGDIEWSVSADVTKTADDGVASYNDKAASDSFSASHLSVRNMDMLCRYLSTSDMLYRGEARRVIVLDMTELDGDDREGAWAEYIYAFVKLNTEVCSNVTKYICLMDEDDADTRSLLKYIDSVRYFPELSEYALGILGLDSWERIINSEFDSGVLRTVVETSVSLMRPETVVGNYTLFDFSDTKNPSGWVPSVNCTIISTGNEVIDHSSLLTASLNRNDQTPYQGIMNKLTRPLDLTAAPYMSFDVQITGNTHNSAEQKLIVTVYSGYEYIELTGRLTPSEWTHIELDLTPFEKLSSVDKIRIWVEDGSSKSETTTLMLGNIVLSSLEYDNETLQKLLSPASVDGDDRFVVDVRIIWGLVLVAAVSATAFVLHMLSINRKIDIIKKERSE